MKVFLVYNQRHLEALRLIAQSWTARGWHTRLYLPRTTPRPKRGSVMMDSRVVNFGCRPGQPRRIAVYGRKGWRRAKLVKFPSGKLDQILTCGRPINS
jgi:hypothetical protein